MKYIKQYEAFDASILNNILSFLKDKSSNGIDKFKKDFKIVSESGDFKMNELKLDNVKYLKYQEALDLIGDDEKLRYIKFWFSSEKGYITYTGTSNVKMEVASGEQISQEILDKLSKENNIKGYLRKVESGGDLVTGDYIVLKLGYRTESDSYITTARIYIEHGYTYAIQNCKPGSNPNGGNWRDYGEYSWSIAYNGNISEDNSFLSKIEVDENCDTLKYKDVVKINDDEFKWNLPYRL